MADNLPDVSAIVKMIMDNPRLVEEIGAMVKNDAVSKKSEPEDKDGTNIPNAEAISVVGEIPTEGSKSRSRKDLLFALKPYLSEKRGRAIDSMLSVADVLTVLKR